MMDAKKLGERLRMIRVQLGIKQQQLADATHLTQPAISRLERGEEVYASVLLAVLSFYQDKVSLDHLFDPDSDINDKGLPYCSQQEVRQRIEDQLVSIAHVLDEGQKKITALRDAL